MGPVQEYWRDKVAQLLGFGTAFVLLVVGYGVNDPDRFYVGWVSALFCMARESPGWGAELRGGALLSVSTIFLLAWPLAINTIYKRFLSSCTDETVIPRKWVMTYAIGVALVSVAFTLGMVVA